jgi:hypothetical protein
MVLDPDLPGIGPDAPEKYRTLAKIGLPGGR